MYDAVGRKSGLLRHKRVTANAIWLKASGNEDESRRSLS